MLHRRDTDSVDAAERPTDEHYRRYLTLVRRGTRGRAGSRSGWRAAGAFRVLDPGLLGDARARLPRTWPGSPSALGEPALAEESRAAGERVIAALRARADSDGLIRPVDRPERRRCPR